MKAGTMARDLPYVKREAMRLLTAEYPSKEVALQTFADSLRGFYSRTYPEIATARAADVSAAVTSLGAIYARNVFPKMNIGWGTYPNMLGHRDDSGCFRCHDDNHTSADGKSISQDCSTCHNLLAMQEENPPILQALYGNP
jgi:hypothetical protein